MLLKISNEELFDWYMVPINSKTYMLRLTSYSIESTYFRSFSRKFGISRVSNNQPGANIAVLKSFALLNDIA